MRTYGKSIFEKNGFTMVEVLETNSAGLKVVIGYALLNPDGKGIEFGSYHDVLGAFETATDDNEPTAGYQP